AAYEEIALGNRKDVAMGVLNAAVMTLIGRPGLQVRQPQDLRLAQPRVGFLDALAGKGNGWITGIGEAQRRTQIDGQDGSVRRGLRWRSARLLACSTDTKTKA